MNKELAECAKDAALKAGKILKEGYGTTFDISSKEGINNLVTEYDHKAEELIINHIKSIYPDHSFLAEESGKSGDKQQDKIHWLIDPLDGTVNFAHCIPVFSVSIAAQRNGDLLCGVIYQPLLDELFIAIKDEGAYLNGKKISVSDNGDLSTSFLVTGFPYNVEDNPCRCVDLFVDIVQRGIPIRRLGSAALDLAYVAAGRFDGFWEIGLHPWDVAAGVLLIREAGGKVTQFSGDEYSIHDNTLLATNGSLHNEIKGILRT
ncbi:MAG: inositol monophosphatase family protein, partial [Bacteroidota bacterium]